VKNYTVKRYQESDYDSWNTFVSQAKNATFLFHRDFMEYHKDRFEDYSLMVFDGEKLIAILPANRAGEIVYSHQGLTYGGLVYSSGLNAEKVELILDDILLFLKENSVNTFYYKPIPSFYFLEGNAEIDFFLIKKGAVIEKKEMNLAVNLISPFTISKSKLKHFRKIKKFDLEFVEEQNLDPFFSLILEPRLLEKHNVKPVHSKEEISKLKHFFSDNIKQFSVYLDNCIIAGVTIFETEKIVKSQYGATSEKGEEVRALDFLFINLIKKYQQEGKHFFDMGIVGDNNEKGYNAGLLKQKEELGCTVYNQDFYKINIR
jgi:hypothetical protein